MPRRTRSPLDVLIVAVPETAGSALYGMSDVLNAAGNIWQTLARSDTPQQLFRVRIVVAQGEVVLRAVTACRCGRTARSDADPHADIVILPELWLGPDEPFKGRYPALMDWLRKRHRAGSHLYSACSGAVMLAETGLLDGKPATSHWGYCDLFARDYPHVRFEPAPNLVFADATGRIVTAGGTTSWHDLAIHIVSRHGSPGEALRIAQVYLLKWHGEGQLPYTPLVRRTPHADAAVRRCERWLGEHFRTHGAVQRAVDASGIPERSLKRRFKAATGTTLIDYLQNLRVEAAKRLLESTSDAIDDISSCCGYEDASFFRRVFKRRTGLGPAEYRRMFKPFAGAAR